MLCAEMAMKKTQILSQVFILLLFVCGGVFQACSDSKDKDKDVFDFEGGEKDKILTIEVVNTQDESLLFKTNETKSIFQSDVLRPTLLFFLSQNCEECQGELLHILDLHNKYQEFISIIAISPKDELMNLQRDIDNINPRFKLYAPIDNKNILHFLNKDENQSYIALYDKQGEKIIDYVGLVPEEMIELDIQYLIQDQLEQKAQYEMQTIDPSAQEALENLTPQDTNTQDSQEVK